MRRREEKVDEAKARFFKAVEKGGKERTIDILEEGLRPLLMAGGDDAARIFTEGREVIVAAGQGSSAVQEYYDRFYPMMPPSTRDKVWGFGGYAKEAERKEEEQFAQKRGFFDILFGR
jgi:hypothetical protein